MQIECTHILGTDKIKHRMKEKHQQNIKIKHQKESFPSSFSKISFIFLFLDFFHDILISWFFRVFGEEDSLVKRVCWPRRCYNINNFHTNKMSRTHHTHTPQTQIPHTHNTHRHTTHAQTTHTYIHKHSHTHTHHTHTTHTHHTHPRIYSQTHTHTTNTHHTNTYHIQVSCRFLNHSSCKIMQDNHLLKILARPC